MSVSRYGEVSQQNVSQVIPFFKSKAQIGVVAGLVIVAIGYLLQRYSGLGSMYTNSIMAGGAAISLGSLTIACLRSCQDKKKRIGFLDGYDIKDELHDLAKTHPQWGIKEVKSAYPLFEVLDKPQVVKQLLLKGANPNEVNLLYYQDPLHPQMSTIDRRTPLHIAALSGYSQTVKVLLEHQPPADIHLKDSHNNTPLHLVADDHSAKLLIDARADIEAKNKWGETPLYRAICLNRHGVVYTLVEEGASLTDTISHAGYNALQAAVAAKDFTLVDYFLRQEGVEVNSSAGSFMSPLHLAVKGGDLDIVTALVDAEADRDKVEDLDNTPLHLATTREVAELLCTDNNLNAININGRTPLHEAVAKNNIEVVRFLIEKNADLTIQDYEGKTPLDLATSPEMRQLLL